MTKEQQRARARRRHEERLKAAKPAVSEDRKDKQLFGIILAVILIIGLVILVPKLLPERSPEPDPAATAAAAGLQPGQNLAAGCTTPPPLQAKPKTFPTAPDKATAAGKTWIATVKTTCGTITLALYGAKAPQTVASFSYLARQGYWAPSPCHRLTSDSIHVLQCGDPTGTGQGDPGYAFGIENAPADGKYPAGSLAMARTQDPDSNGGQFFIAYQDTTLPTEGGGYSLFGKVTGGLDIIQRIAAAKALDPSPADGTPASPISILDVKVAKVVEVAKDTEKKS